MLITINSGILVISQSVGILRPTEAWLLLLQPAGLYPSHGWLVSVFQDAPSTSQKSIMLIN